MSLHLILVYLLGFLSGATAKSVAPELYITGIGIGSSNDQPLVDRSAQQDNTYSDFSSVGDISVFGDNPDSFPTTPGESGDDLALLDGEVYSLNQQNPQLGEDHGNTEGLAGQDPGNLDLFVESSAEVAPSCGGGDDLDSFINNPSTLTSRNLIDDSFDLRIPEEILAPNKLCPNPLDEKPTSPENGKLPFRIPLPDYGGKRCRMEVGEGPLYALCCWLPESGNKEHACYPGTVSFSFSLSVFSLSVCLFS